jgi:hypothetical protein
VPAKKLPGKAIKDEPRIGHAKSHREEVERLYHGAGFDPVRYGEQQSDKEQVDELVNRFFDASDEERERERAEQEKELRHKTMDTPPSGRARFKRAQWATEFLKRYRAHVRQKKIAEEEDIRWQRAQWVKELLKQKRAEQAQKEEEEDYAREQKNRTRSKKLKREATEWLKQRDRSTSRREE